MKEELINKPVRAWWLSNGTLRHGDGRKANVGETHTVDNPLLLYINGLRGSTNILTTLNDGYGQYLYRTEHAGKVQREWGIVCSTERTYLWRVDCEVLFRKFARMCALDVTGNWEAPDLVVQWLRTGDDSLRGEAYEAARYSADALANANAGSAKELAADSAANAAAHRAADRAAYWVADRAAYWVADRAAYWVAHRAAYRAADSTAALAAESASGVKPLTRLLPYGTAYAAARKKQSRRLYRMVMAQHRKEASE